MPGVLANGNPPNTVASSTAGLLALGGGKFLQVAHRPVLGAHVEARQQQALIEDAADRLDLAGDSPLQHVQHAPGGLAHVDVRVGAIDAARGQICRQLVGEIAVQVETRTDRDVGLDFSDRAQKLDLGILAQCRDARAVQRQVDRVELRCRSGRRLSPRGRPQKLSSSIWPAGEAEAQRNTSTSQSGMPVLELDHGAELAFQRGLVQRLLALEPFPPLEGGTVGERPD